MWCGERATRIFGHRGAPRAFSSKRSRDEGAFLEEPSPSQSPFPSKGGLRGMTVSVPLSMALHTPFHSLPDFTPPPNDRARSSERIGMSANSNRRIEYSGLRNEPGRRRAKVQGVVSSLRRLLCRSRGGQKPRHQKSANRLYFAQSCAQTIALRSRSTILQEQK